MGGDYLQYAVIVVRPIYHQDRRGQTGALSHSGPITPRASVGPAVALKAFYPQAVELSELPLLLGLGSGFQLQVESPEIGLESEGLRELGLVAFEPDVVRPLPQPREDLADEPHLLRLAVEGDLEARVVGADDVLPRAGQLGCELGPRPPALDEAEPLQLLQVLGGRLLALPQPVGQLLSRERDEREVSFQLHQLDEGRDEDGFDLLQCGAFLSSQADFRTPRR